MSISQSSRDRFLGVWPQLRDELVEYMKGEKMPADAVSWFKKVRDFVQLDSSSQLTLVTLQNLDHNTPGGA